MLRAGAFVQRRFRWSALASGGACSPPPRSPATPTHARAAITATTPAAESYQPSYASIVVDANSGAVMQATNADSPRHPASLTKIMTLYLLFERLEAGKIKLNDRDAGRPPTPPRRRRPSSASSRAQTHRRRNRDPRHRHQIGQRRGGDRGRGARRQRARIRQADDRQGARARHDAHHLSQRLRPARRPADHHRARPGHSRPRHRRIASRNITTTSPRARSRSTAR